MVRSSKIGKILKNNRRQKKQSDKSSNSDIVSPLLNPRTIIGDYKTQNPKVIIENTEESDDFENRTRKSSNYSDFKRSFDRFDDIRRNRVRKCGHFPDYSFESSASDAETSAETSESEIRDAEPDKKGRSRLSTVHLLTPSPHEIRRSITIDQSENLLSSTNRLGVRRTPPFRRTTTTPLLTAGIDRLMFEHLRHHHRRMTATAQQFGRDYLIRKIDEAEDEDNNNNNVTSADCSDLPEFEEFLSDEEDEHGRHDSLLKKVELLLIPQSELDVNKKQS